MKIIKCLVLVTVVSLYSCSQELITNDSDSNNSSTMIPTTYTAKYSFEETIGPKIINSNGNYYNGSIYGAVRVAGKVGNAIDFHSAGYVILGEEEGSGTIVLENSIISIDAWVYLYTVVPGSFYKIISNKIPVESFKMRLNSGKIEFLIENYDRNAYDSIIIGNNILTANQWHHIAVTFNGNKAITYIDGIKDNEVNISFLIHNSYTPLIIGASRDNTERFDGIIDELRIIELELSPEEINAYYQSTK